MNKIQLIGRIANDLELKQAQTGTAICQFNLAVNRRFKKDGGQEADFITVICFGKTAENLVAYKQKGEQVAVAGTLNIDNYDKDGERKSFTKVVADEIEFIGQKSAGTANNSEVGFQAIHDDDIPF